MEKWSKKRRREAEGKREQYTRKCEEAKDDVSAQREKGRSEVGKDVMKSARGGKGGREKWNEK